MLDRELNKQKKLPGPGQYLNMKEMKDEMHLAKSMLGGKMEASQLVDNGVPGPATYQNILVDEKAMKNSNNLPGFRIVQDTSKVRKEEDKNKIPVGPMSYYPEKYDQYQRESKRIKIQIGNSTRPDMI